VNCGSVVIVVDAGERATRAACFGVVDGATTLVAEPADLRGALPRWERVEVWCIETPGAMPGELSLDVRSCRTVPLGDVLHAFASEQGRFVGDRPVCALDLGHRSSRMFLLEPAAGVVDALSMPHGGCSFVEFARRYALERRLPPGPDAELLRQLDAGLDIMTFGGLTIPTRTFFDMPRRDLACAIVSDVGARLRRHVEMGGAWPGTLLVTGGPAREVAPEVSRQLRERRMAIEQVDVVPTRSTAAIAMPFAAQRLRELGGAMPKRDAET